MSTIKHYTTEFELTAIADAIRERGGITEKLVWPNGFISATNALPMPSRKGTLLSILNKTIEEIEIADLSVIPAVSFRSCSALTTASFPACTTIGAEAFSKCTALSTISFPACTTINNYAFSACYALATASFPACTTISSYAFQFCYALTTVSFPACTTIGSCAFQFCSALTTASFPACTSIGGSAFYYCSALMSLYLLGSSYVTMPETALNSTPMSKSTYTGAFGSIYVPASMLASYKTRTGFIVYSNRLVGVEV